MCAPAANDNQVPTPIIINGIPFDEDNFDPIDLELEEDFDFDEAASDNIQLFISDSESVQNWLWSLSDSIDFTELESEDLDSESDLDQDSSSDELYPAALAFQERLYHYLLVSHSSLRTYNSESALNYSIWIIENRTNFPPDLDDFIDIQLGIILDIIIQSY